MPVRDPVYEVLDDVRMEMRDRRAQLLAFATYVVLAAGLLYLFSSIGEDSRTAFDTVRRTTLIAVGAGLLDLGVLLGAVTLVVDRNVRRRALSRAPVRYLRSRSTLVLAMATGAALSLLAWYVLLWA